MATKRTSIDILDLRGGQNSTDPPLTVGQNQCVEAKNIDWSKGPLGGKRDGSTSFSMTSSGLTGKVSALVRHTPSADEGVAELWAFDQAAKIARHVPSTGWAAITPKDAPTGGVPSGGTLPEIYPVGASLNGKFFFTYKNAQSRLQVWDGTTARRAGLAAPSAVPTGVLAAGAVTASRKYKTAVTVQSGGVTIRRSELSDFSAVLSPSGQQVTVTINGKPNEGETHWELYAYDSSDSYGVGFLIATTAIATATAVDNNASLDVSTFATLAPNVLVNATITAPRYLIADENRLIFAGDFADTFPSRVSWTPVIGSGVGDDERVNKSGSYYIDLDAGDGGGITGLGGPLLASVYVFKLSQIYKLVRTGSSATPYVPVTISKNIGALRQQSIVLGEDESGAPALYFWSARGPYRIGNRGLEYLGRDIESIVDTVNISTADMNAHGIWYPKKRQVWWWLATSGTTPDTRVVFNVKNGRSSDQGVRGGWSVDTGTAVSALCSCIYGDVSSSRASLVLTPRFGISGSNNTVWKGDNGTDDAGTSYQAYVKTRPFSPGGVRRYGRFLGPVLFAKADSATIQLSIIKDFGLETVSGSVTISASGSETHVTKDVEDARASRAVFAQFQYGDSAASTQTWTVHALIVPVDIEEEFS